MSTYAVIHPSMDWQLSAMGPYWYLKVIDVQMHLTNVFYDIDINLTYGLMVQISTYTVMSTVLFDNVVWCVLQVSSSGQLTLSLAQWVVLRVSQTLWVSRLPLTPFSHAATAMETSTSLRYIFYYILLQLRRY